MGTNHRETKGKTINFDPCDYDGMLKIMDEHGDSTTMFSGTNENREETSISIYQNGIVTCTNQRNGFVRVNTYWRDGTAEETFTGKWK